MLNDMLYFMLFIFLFTLTVWLPVRGAAVLVDWLIG